MRRLPAVLLVACLALVGCSTEVAPTSAAPTAPPSAEPPASHEAFPLLSVETIGGECAEGACHRLVNLDSDGRLHEVIPNDRIVGTVPKELVDALQVEMDQANFNLIESKRFSGECPTAVDGLELIYTFHLVMGDEEIRSCTVAIDERHPLFRAVAAVMALVGS